MRGENTVPGSGLDHLPGLGDLPREGRQPGGPQLSGQSGAGVVVVQLHHTAGPADLCGAEQYQDTVSLVTGCRCRDLNINI